MEGFIVLVTIAALLVGLRLLLALLGCRRIKEAYAYYRGGEVFVALDLETTGLSPKRDTIIEVAAVKFRGVEKLDTFSTLCKPDRTISRKIRELTGINNRMVAKAPAFWEIIPEFDTFLGSHLVVGHNIAFDLYFLKSHGMELPNPSFDTLEMSRLLAPGARRHTLTAVASHLRVKTGQSHRALGDAETVAKVFPALMEVYGRNPPWVVRFWRRFS